MSPRAFLGRERRDTKKNRRTRHLLTRILPALAGPFALVVASLAPAPARATTALTECRFSSYQVFDVQWYISGGNLNISGITRPYDTNFSQPTLESGDYFQFFNSATDPGTYGLKLFNGDNSLQQVMHDTGDFSAIGSDFVFYQGSGFFGTVVTTTAGFAYGSSASLPVTQQNPTNEQVAAAVNCSATPIAQVGPAPTTTTAPAETTTTSTSTTSTTTTTTTTLPPAPASYTATSTDRDFYFQVSSAQTFTVRTYAWQFGIDSMLWLYNASDAVITANDDHFGLDSFISVNLEPGAYRLRAGVCCGNPAAWYGTSYTIQANLTPTNPPPTTTTTTTTSTVPQTTTTTTTTTTTVPPPPATLPPITVAPVLVGPAPEPVEPTPTTLAPVASSLPPTPVATSAPATTAPVTTAAPVTTTQPAQEPQTPTTVPSTVPSTTTLPTPTAEELTNILEEETEVSPEVATAIATNAAVLATVTAEQATQVFAAIDQGALTDEAAAAIVAAVQDAPTEVKEAFEAEINVYGGQFDNYVPTGSNISVGERRTIVAVNALVTGAATAAAGGALGGSRSPSPSGGSGPTTHQNDATRKPEEEGEEPAGEIAGESDGTKIRFIYFDEENKMHINWKNFFKKLWKETAALAFTLAGSAVVFVTLSGFTQTVALVATGIALVVHYINVMSDQGDEE